MLTCVAGADAGIGSEGVRIQAVAKDKSKDRLICSRRRQNRLEHKVDGVSCVLPGAYLLTDVVLGPDEAILWSWSDLTGAFQLFALPPAWLPFFALNLPFSSSDLDLPGTERRFLALTGVPMGWTSAMGIVQHAQTSREDCKDPKPPDPCEAF